MPGRKLARPGDIFRQPDLARTLRSMAAAEKRALEKGASREAAIDAVRDFFYRGDIARKIGRFVKRTADCFDTKTWRPFAPLLKNL